MPISPCGNSIVLASITSSVGSPLRKRKLSGEERIDFADFKHAEALQQGEIIKRATITFEQKPSQMVRHFRLRSMS